MGKLQKISIFIRENDLKTITTVVKRRIIAKMEKSFYSKNPAITDRENIRYPLKKTKIEKVFFLFDPLNAQKGSTILRCHQVSQIVQGAGSLLPVEITSDISAIKNSIIIMDKYSSTYAGNSAIGKLRESNNLLISDPVDDEILTEKYSRFDGLIASSLKQHLFFKEHLPNIPVAYLFHHSDIRLAKTIAPQDQFRAAYFGEPSNMYDFPGLDQWINPVSVDTSRQKLDWMSLIPNFNFHYAVRSKGYSSRVFKPFTKGIIAAQFEANILVHQDDGDAGMYLGDSYPYLLKGELSPESVLEMLKFAQTSFGGAEWNHGLEIMKDLKEKTAPSKLKEDFWSFIKQFI